LLAVTFVALFCGCSESNEDDVKSAKRFEELKTLPLDTVLSRAFAFYEQFQATNDALLRDSIAERSRQMIPWRLIYAKSMKRFRNIFMNIILSICIGLCLIQQGMNPFLGR
jgi:hypothetical protein